MSINAISSLSIYEYYYRINKEDESKKKSPLEREMKQYGLTPTDNEALNVAMLQKAKELEKQQKAQEEKETSKLDRPWADLMYQLNIPFNEDPSDDIQDIKNELALLLRGIDDEELTREVRDLEDYVESLYISFNRNNQTNIIDSSALLYNQLNSLSVLNKANLL